MRFPGSGGTHHGAAGRVNRWPRLFACSVDSGCKRQSWRRHNVRPRDEVAAAASGDRLQVVEVEPSRAGWARARYECEPALAMTNPRLRVRGHPRQHIVELRAVLSKFQPISVVTSAAPERYDPAA